MEQFTSMLPLVLVFGLMYLLIIRPQSKKAKEHQAMLSSLHKGERVLLNGGIIGTITQIHEKELNLEIAPGVVVSAARSMIAYKMSNDSTKVKENDSKAVDKTSPKAIQKSTTKSKKPITKK